MRMADGMDDDERGLDRRLVVLETRFDTILPTLATKADLERLEAGSALRATEFRGEYKGEMAELRAEIKQEMAELREALLAKLHSAMASMYKWIAATCVTLILGFSGTAVMLFSQVNARSDRVDAHLQEFDAKFQRMDARFERLEKLITEQQRR